MPFNMLATKGLRGQDLKTIYYYIYSLTANFGACSFVNDVRLEKRERVARLGRRFC